MDKSCRVEGCKNKANVSGSAQGLCRAHYRRWQRYGDENEPLRRVQSWKGEVCTEPDCAKPIEAHGLCVNHYSIAHRRNDPTAQAKRNKAFKLRLNERQERLMGRPRPERCELCNSPGYNKGRTPYIVFDHDHSTGEPRGWLCDRCNKVLGLVKDNPDLLEKLRSYLENSNGETNIKRTQLFAVK